MTTQQILQGVHAWVNGKIVYDISAAHPDGQGNPTPYANLTAALGTGGANIPEALRKGGMSVKFVSSSDNKYVQYRLMPDEFTTDTTQWAIADEGVYVENPEFVYVKADREDKILWGIKADGTVYFGAGVPPQVVDYIQQKIEELSLDEYEDIVAFLNDLEKGDKTLQTLLNEKVDKEESKSLIDAEFASSQSVITNPEYIQIEADSEDKILSARKTDGTKVENVGLEVKGTIDIDGATYSLCQSPEWIKVLIDSKERIIAGVKTDGSVYINKIEGVTDAIQEIREALGVLEESTSSLDETSMKSIQSLALRTNTLYRQTKQIKDGIDNNMPALLSLKDNEQTIKTITISSVGAKDKYVVRLRLHYEAEKYTPSNNDVFFDGNCNTDFSDVRFLDSNGKIIKATFGKAYNLGVYRDTNLSKSTFVPIFNLPDGRIICYSENSQSMIISSDNGEMWSTLQGTKLNAHASDVYGTTGIVPVYVDSEGNIFGFAGGILYKLLSEDNYATINEVLDYRWENSNGDTVYSEIQMGQAMTTDINGIMYVGLYQATRYYRVAIYKSTDGGNTWSVSYLNDNTATTRNEQHVHHIHADKYSSAVYAGIDGGLNEDPHILLTKDGGNTWTNISSKVTEQRGHDYFPTYFGSDYMLGGGENYTLGGNAVVRGINETSDIAITASCKGWGGVRSFADFGDDSMIIAGVSQDMLYLNNYVLVSFDKGKTFDVIYVGDNSYLRASGDGFRVVRNLGTILGDTEPCIVCQCGTNAPALRIYKGGSHYYREVELLLENIPSGDISITVKSGYSIPYPYNNIRGIKEEGNVYGISFSEGCGNYVQDSNGKVLKINGDCFWDVIELPKRISDYAGSFDTYYPFEFSSAAKIKGALNLGNIEALNFSDGYSISFWMNEKNRLRETGFIQGQGFTNEYYIICSLGSYDLVRFQRGIGFIKRGDSSAATDNSKRKILNLNYYSLGFSDNYYNAVITINSSTVKLYINGIYMDTSNDMVVQGNWNGYTDENLSSREIIIGSQDTIPAGYISNFKIFDKVLSSSEILDIYKGYNF